MLKVLIYKGRDEFVVVDVPDSYYNRDFRPERGHPTDRRYRDKMSALADARSRHGGKAFVIDESDM